MAARITSKTRVFLSVLPIFLAVVVGAAATVDAAGTLPVPVVTIYPGDSISAQLLRTGRFPDQVISHGGYVRNVERLTGMVARRTLIRGRAIPENSVRKPYTIRNGQVVTIRYQTGALYIVAKAIALKAGVAGDFIQARNVDTGRTVAGTVQTDGSIMVSLK